eukprot:g29389.t1
MAISFTDERCSSKEACITDNACCIDAIAFSIVTSNYGHNVVNSEDSKLEKRFSFNLDLHALEVFTFGSGPETLSGTSKPPCFGASGQPMHVVANREEGGLPIEWCQAMTGKECWKPRFNKALLLVVGFFGIASVATVWHFHVADMTATGATTALWDQYSSEGLKAYRKRISKENNNGDSADGYELVSWDEVMCQALKDNKQRIVRAVAARYPSTLRASCSSFGSPLEYAMDRNPDMVEVLLQHGADVAKVDKAGNTALWYAASVGSAFAATSLLEGGSESVINKKGAQGKTPFAIACWNTHPEVLQVLAQHGADPNIPEDHGQSPLSLATQFSMHLNPAAKPISTPQSVDTVDQWTARSQELLGVLKVLVAAKVNLNIYDFEGMTPLLNLLRFNKNQWGVPAQAQAFAQATQANANFLLQSGANPNMVGAMDLAEKLAIRFAVISAWPAGASFRPGRVKCVNGTTDRWDQRYSLLAKRPILGGCPLSFSLSRSHLTNKPSSQINNLLPRFMNWAGFHEPRRALRRELDLDERLELLEAPRTSANGGRPLLCILSHWGIDRPRPLPPRAVLVGPVEDYPGKVKEAGELPKPVADWLASGKVVYISFGTNVRPTREVRCPIFDIRMCAVTP